MVVSTQVGKDGHDRCCFGQGSFIYFFLPVRRLPLLLRAAAAQQTQSRRDTPPSSQCGTLSHLFRSRCSGRGKGGCLGGGRWTCRQLTAHSSDAPETRQDKSTMTTRMTPQQLAPLSLFLFSSFSCCFFSFLSRSFFFSEGKKAPCHRIADGQGWEDGSIRRPENHRWEQIGTGRPMAGDNDDLQAQS